MKTSRRRGSEPAIVRAVGETWGVQRGGEGAGM